MAMVHGVSAHPGIGPGTTLAALLFAMLIPSPGCSLLLRPESRDFDASGADADVDVDHDEDLDDAVEPDVDEDVDVEPDTEHGSDADDAEICSVCPPGYECSDAGICECVPECGERQCGDNGCAGSCGSCPAGATCTDEGRCLCSDGRTPCGAACCSDQQCCSADACIDRACDPGWECGQDACGGTCWSCPGEGDPPGCLFCVGNSCQAGSVCPPEGGTMCCRPWESCASSGHCG